MSADIYEYYYEDYNESSSALDQLGLNNSTGLPAPTEQYTYKSTPILSNNLFPKTIPRPKSIKASRSKPPKSNNTNLFVPPSVIRASSADAIDDDINDNDFGTSNDYINKNLLKMMDDLNISQNGRKGILKQGQTQKIKMVSQWLKTKPNKNAIPIAPSMTEAISIPNVNHIHHKHQLQPHPIVSSKSYNNIDSKKVIKPNNKKFNGVHKINLNAQNENFHQNRLSLLEPIVGDYEDNGCDIKQEDGKKKPNYFKRNSAKFNNNSNKLQSKNRHFKQSASAMVLPPPVPKSIKNKYKNNPPNMKTVKLKLKLGSLVEVYSHSQNKWSDGKITRIKGKLILITYGPTGSTQKWLEATSKDFRPKLHQIAQSVALPQKELIDKRRSAKLKEEIPPLLNHLNVNNNNKDFDEHNNPSPQRFRKSVALQQNKTVKVKLRIGSPVEVYSDSKKKWTNGKITAIKKGLLRVAYGKGLSSEKWLTSQSKQFRPKLQLVEDAISNTNTNLKNNNKNQYDLANEENQQQYKPQPLQPKQPQQPQQPPAPDAYNPSGAYITHSLRREQYQNDSIPSIKGTNSKRGDLKIKINGALELRSTCNFASCKVAEHNLKTQKVKSDSNPVWKEVLVYSNYRPHIGKTAVIMVGNKSAIREKIIGTAEFELAIVFNQEEKLTIDLRDKNGLLSGLIVVEQVVVESGR